MTACRVPLDKSLSKGTAVSSAEPSVLIGFAHSLFFQVLLLTLLFICVSTSPLSAFSQISDYRVVFIPFYDENGTLQAAVRRYDRDGHPRFLVLDPQRFALSEMTAEKIHDSRPAGEEAWRRTPFSLALARQTSPPYPLQNDGLREAEHPVTGFFLTADLCPARKPLDRAFFEATMALPQKPPVPVALMITGLWIQRHEADLTWLKDQVAAGRLAITWVNHSFTHPYNPAAPPDRNFLLMNKREFAHEVLVLERLLLEHDLIPSPFFRFPGLVSDRQLIENLRDLHLIPIGSNAWLAKGESPRTGSVILVHANGNEPDGIRRLFSFYDTQRQALLRGSAALLPLGDAFLTR